ncbi:uncharacterized protein CELE_Y61B8B.3 [Caenorhabditis elegans]|uniref:Uncharacterized protein n=1 Tax=Caenorhabditis elegans TaxID=6239 RepID=A0A3B1E8T6_CAEEL|nr:Uncharacterized protein CELE_Y61B8B.3 [Caenorhabditis elegans]VAY52536.1 Uncharacterized protein CELE_Y61B8B.3 [Caenorhabditis elegans]|eukprot:NP_001355449.1 Uncharacterized protein CELE_Y61B8B.3 [Caenorhabditis elegans]
MGVILELGILLGERSASERQSDCFEADYNCQVALVKAEQEKVIKLEG